MNSPEDAELVEALNTLSKDIDDMNALNARMETTLDEQKPQVEKLEKSTARVKALFDDADKRSMDQAARIERLNESHKRIAASQREQELQIEKLEKSFARLEERERIKEKLGF